MPRWASCQTTRRSSLPPTPRPPPPSPAQIGRAGYEAVAGDAPKCETSIKLGDQAEGCGGHGCLADGAAAKQGLKPGDVIVEVQQSEVNTPADVQEHVDFSTQGKPQVGADADPAGRRNAVGAGPAGGGRSGFRGAEGLTKTLSRLL